MSDDNTPAPEQEHQEQQEQNQQKRAKRKILASTPRDATDQVVVLEPEMRGPASGDQWESYTVGVGKAGTDSKVWYELPVVVAGIGLTPEDALDLALGRHILREKVLKPEQIEERKAKGQPMPLLAMQAFPDQWTNKKTGYVNNEFKVVVAEAKMRKADGQDGEPIGFHMLAVPGDQKTGKKPVYADIWRSQWSFDGVTAPDGSPLPKLDLIECYQIVREGKAVYRETNKGEIQIKMKGLETKPGTKFIEVKFEPWQAHLSQQQKQSQGAARGGFSRRS